MNVAVRNWWVKVSVDGKKTPIGFGPRAKDGGFSIRIFQREKGGIGSPLFIRAVAVGNRLTLELIDSAGHPLFCQETER